jgi:hypothetical protein
VELPRVLLALLVGLGLDGLGQGLGYAAGPGRSAEALASYEFRRVDHVRDADRAVFAEAGAP